MLTMPTLANVDLLTSGKPSYTFVLTRLIASLYSVAAMWRACMYITELCHYFIGQLVCS